MTIVRILTAIRRPSDTKTLSESIVARVVQTITRTASDSISLADPEPNVVVTQGVPAPKIAVGTGGRRSKRQPMRFAPRVAYIVHGRKKPETVRKIKTGAIVYNSKIKPTTRYTELPLSYIRKEVRGVSDTVLASDSVSIRERHTDIAPIKKQKIAELSQQIEGIIRYISKPKQVAQSGIKQIEAALADKGFIGTGNPIQPSIQVRLVWVSSADVKTCVICRRLEGMEFDLNQAPDDIQSLSHNNCRCRLMYVEAAAQAV